MGARRAALLGTLVVVLGLAWGARSLTPGEATPAEQDRIAAAILDARLRRLSNPPAAVPVQRASLIDCLRRNGFVVRSVGSETLAVRAAGWTGVRVRIVQGGAERDPPAGWGTINNVIFTPLGAPPTEIRRGFFACVDLHAGALSRRRGGGGHGH